MSSSISGFKGSNGVSTQTSSLILAVSYFKDMLITLINEMHKLGGFLTDDGFRFLSGY